MMILTKIKVFRAQLLQRIFQRLLHAQVVVVTELGGKEERLAGHTRRADALTHLRLVRVCGCGIDELVSVAQSELNSVLNLTRC